MCPRVTRGEEPGAKVGSVDQLIFGLTGFVRTSYPYRAQNAVNALSLWPLFGGIKSAMAFRPCRLPN